MEEQQAVQDPGRADYVPRDKKKKKKVRNTLHASWGRIELMKLTSSTLGGLKMELGCGSK